MATRQHLVVIVDDDEGTRDAMRALLSAFGYPTALFTSGEDFLRAAPGSKVSCVLLDIQLGGMSGLELAGQLAGTGFSCPIIFMTGSLDESFEKQALALGGVAFLRKPFPADRLIEAIKKATAISSEDCSAEV